MKIIWKCIKYVVVAWLLIVGIALLAMSSKSIPSSDLLTQIELGMSREKAIYVVGKTMKYSQENFTACDDKTRPWRGDCAALKRAGAQSFLVWKLGASTLLVVGLDAQEKVVFRGLGEV